MKRVMLAAGVVAALAAAANAAQVNLFYTSSADPLAATPALAIANSHNPVLPAGTGIPIDLWMAIPTSGVGVTGMGLDSTAAGGSTGSVFVIDNSTGRWSTAAVNGSAGSIWSGLLGVTANPAGVGPGGLQPTGTGEGPIGSLLVYHLGSGTIDTVAGDAMYIQISDFSSIGTTQGTGLAAFGFGGPLAGGPIWDTSGYFTADGSDAEGAGSQAGFLADGAVNGPVATRIPDMTVVPEPTTLALMGLAGLLIRRRK